MLKQKSLGSLAAAALLCMAVLLSPVTSSADTSGGLTLTVVPSLTTASLGENVSYNYVITSTCNTTVSSLVLTDDKLGTISLPATSLATGENITVSVARTVVSGDFPGPLANTATVTGVAADNTSLSAGATASVTLNTPASSMTVNLSAITTSATAGAVVTYTYTVTNTGAAALNSLILTDSRLGAVTLGSTSLAAGASVTASKAYTVLSTDVSPLTNTATATATSSTGSAVTATSATVSVTLTANSDNATSALSVKLSASRQAAYVGDVIIYTYSITNTGTATLANLSLTDSRLGSIPLPFTKLAPRQQVKATGKYAVLTADLPGPLTNYATAAATSASGASLTAASATVSVTLAKNTGNRPSDNLTPPGDNWTKGDWLKFKGVPGKGILHAPGLLKPFNPNSHNGWSDNQTGHPGFNNEDDGDNGRGQGPEHKNGKDKNKGNGNH